MSSCGITDENDAPVLDLTMVGRGEDAMRMDKRLRCAGRALGVAVRIDWQADQYGEPKIYWKDELLIDRLLNTVEIEKVLQPLAQALVLT